MYAYVAMHECTYKSQFIDDYLEQIRIWPLLVYSLVVVSTVCIINL